MLFDNLSKTQEMVLRKISRLKSKMMKAWDENYLFDLYCQADDLWQEYFPFQANQLGDKWEVTKLYNDLSRAIRDKKSVVVNLLGCNVTLATA